MCCIYTEAYLYLMTSTTAPRKLVHFGRHITAGQTITVDQVNGTKVTGKVLRITVANRKTGLRKATMTDGRIAFIEPSRIVKVAR